MTDFDVQIVDDDDLPPGHDWALVEREDGVTVAFVAALALARHPTRTLEECEVAAEVSAGRHRHRFRPGSLFRLFGRATA